MKRPWICYVIFILHISETNKQGTDEKKDGEGIQHPGIVCDGCEGPVCGNRFKCVICPDYDLCEPCEKKGLHSKHDMMKIASPVQGPFCGPFGGPGGPFGGHGGPFGGPGGPGPQVVIKLVMIGDAPCTVFRVV